MKVLTSTILVVLVATSSVRSVAQERWFAYEPATVELEGRLVIQDAYGPPNYGENPRTDRKEKVPVLVLAKPINVRGVPGSEINAETVKGARRIQLVFPYDEIDYQQLIGKKIVVKGSLFHAHTGHHYTPVVMWVRSVDKK